MHDPVTTCVRNKSFARRCAVSPRKIINNVIHNCTGFYSSRTTACCPRLHFKQEEKKSSSYENADHEPIHPWSKPSLWRLFSTSVKTVSSQNADQSERARLIEKPVTAIKWKMIRPGETRTWCPRRRKTLCSLSRSSWGFSDAYEHPVYNQPQAGNDCLTQDAGFTSKTQTRLYLRSRIASERSNSCPFECILDVFIWIIRFRTWPWGSRVRLLCCNVCVCVFIYWCLELNKQIASVSRSGCLGTAGALIYGLRAFKQGKTRQSQLLMRTRIFAQGFTVVAIVVGVAAAALKPRQWNESGFTSGCLFFPPTAHVSDCNWLIKKRGAFWVFFGSFLGRSLLYWRVSGL